MSSDVSLPRVGCGAAILEHGKLLLVCRKRAPEAGCWGLPGGKVDAFEMITDAVIREIREELGIEITTMTLLCVVDQIDRDCQEHWIAPVFRVEGFSGTPSVMEPDALSAMGWFALDRLPSALTQATVQAVAALGDPKH